MSAESDVVEVEPLSDQCRIWCGADEIVAETFGEDNLAGRPARRLYEASGFVVSEHRHETAFPAQ